MGEIYKVSCQCGYEKELKLGGGLASLNIRTVRRLFSDEKRAAFEAYYQSKEVQSFVVENEPAYCDACREIMTVPVLRARLVHGEGMEIIGDCPDCGQKVQRLKDLSCPLCHKALKQEIIGHWD